MILKPINFFFLLSTSLLPNYCLALKEDHTQPYYITSETAVYDKNKHIAIFTGKAVATQGSRILTGDKIVLHLDNDNKHILKLISYGTPATYSMQTEKEKERLNAQADIINYEPRITLATLIHHARVIQGADSITGTYLTYDTNKEIIEINKNIKNKKTEIIIQPEDVH